MSYAPLQIIYPQEASLKPLVKLYYRQRVERVDFQETYTYYPNYTVTLNIYRHSRLSFSDFHRTHTWDGDAPILQLFVGKFNFSRSIEMQGPFDKITLVFHPLGFNHFFTQPVGSLIQEHFAFFSAFGPDFLALCNRLFTEKDLSVVGKQLDQFLTSRLVGFSETRLHKSVQRILDADQPLGIGNLANELGIHRKTLLRLFRRHLNYSPEEYQSVVRFRRAMIQFQESNPKPTLSSLAHANQYYDQSEFNRQFKARSGLSPRLLFEHLQTIQPGLFWTYRKP